MPAIDSFDALHVAVKPAHDGVDVHRCAVQVWERRVVRVFKHRGQIRASQQDRLHAVSLDERLSRSARRASRAVPRAARAWPRQSERSRYRYRLQKTAHPVSIPMKLYDFPPRQARDKHQKDL